MAKKKITENILTPEQHHQQLNACINCIYEDYCSNMLPFPVNLYDCCEKYQKTKFIKKDDR